MDDDVPPIQIQGCPVHFPYKAYPSQLSMMNRIMQCLVMKQNCLLESPTGSGKSLSLLCSSLGWLSKHVEKRRTRILELQAKCEEEEAKGATWTNTTCCAQCSLSANGSLRGFGKPGPNHTKAGHSGTKAGPSEADAGPNEVKADPDEVKADPDEVKADPDEVKVDSNESKKKARISNEAEDCSSSKKMRFCDEESDDDFKEDSFTSSFRENCSKKTEVEADKRRMVAEAEAAEKRAAAKCAELESKEEAPINEDPTTWEGYGKGQSCIGCACHVSDARRELQELFSEKVPTVFYGTRTHNQIAQIIRELKKTKYKNVNTSVLSSRGHSCVNSFVKGHQRMNEACRELIADSNCAYYSKVHRVNNHERLLDEAYLEGAFDVEELVIAVKEVGACPYYTARELIPSANIVFCPYNYLLDPSFRDAIGLNLSGHVVIFDEAHNIENTACDSVSFDISKEQLESAREDLTMLVARKIKEEHHAPLLTMINDMLSVMDLTRPRLNRQDFGDASLVWTGQEIIAFLDRVGIGPSQLKQMYKHYMAVGGEKDRQDEFEPRRQRNKKKEKKEMETSTSILCSSLFLCLGIMFKDNMRFSDDYRIALLETTSYERSEEPSSSGRWHSKRSSQAGGGFKQRQELTLNFWCLNPAVAFHEIARQTRSIILTSGTLSPLNSFASELAMEFPLRLEANHVVKTDQTFVASVGSAPNGGTLCATFQYYETFRFQDDLGSLVLSLCERVPHGVLCFVSSYSLADKLLRRWEDTGLLEKLRKIKHVAVEPRKVADMGPVLEGYYDAVADTVDGPSEDGRTGAFMMAVCRGKMSEGQDFADQNARLVITVGIPYPNVKITKICLKRTYNDKNRDKRELLSGSQWYEVQAFRALNQALGRCIRHRHDWGAVIMIDVRLCERADRYLPSISKWLRQRVERFLNCRSLLSRLEDFVARRKAAETRGEVEIHFRKGRIEDEEEEV